MRIGRRAHPRVAHPPFAHDPRRHAFPGWPADAGSRCRRWRSDLAGGRRVRATGRQPVRAGLCSPARNRPSARVTRRQVSVPPAARLEDKQRVAGTTGLAQQRTVHQPPAMARPPTKALALRAPTPTPAQPSSPHPVAAAKSSHPGVRDRPASPDSWGYASHARIAHSSMARFGKSPD